MLHCPICYYYEQFLLYLNNVWHTLIVLLYLNNVWHMLIVLLYLNNVWHMLIVLLYLNNVWHTLMLWHFSKALVYASGLHYSRNHGNRGGLSSLIYSLDLLQIRTGNAWWDIHFNLIHLHGHESENRLKPHTRSEYRNWAITPEIIPSTWIHPIYDIWAHKASKWLRVYEGHSTGTLTHTTQWV